jgi:hypothetical protein
MSFQALLSLALSHPAQSINALALFFAVTGSWLLIATHIRQRRAVAGLLADADMTDVATVDASTQQLNRFFTRFGYACLGIALAVSWFSTRF